MPTLRIVLVDDERLVRSDLRQMLEEYDDVEVVGEATNVDQAAELVAALDFNAVFLDIQMPRKSGFELLPHLPAHVRIVFVTAFDAYAVRAFEVNSLDYLLKPVSPDRLKITLERLRAADAEKPTPKERFSYEDRLFLLTGRRGKFIPLESVRYVQSSGVYSEIIVGDNERYIDNRSLQSWEELLPDDFVRIHRSYIVNGKRVVGEINRNAGALGIGLHLTIDGLSFPLKVSRRQRRVWEEYRSKTEKKTEK